MLVSHMRTVYASRPSTREESLKGLFAKAVKGAITSKTRKFSKADKTRATLAKRNVK